MLESKKTKFLVLLNLLLFLVYASYNEWQKLQPQEFQAVCQMLGFDDEQNVFGVHCLKK